MEQLIETFIDHYLSRKKIVHRLPVSMPIGIFWPEQQKARRDLLMLFKQGLLVREMDGRKTVFQVVR